MSRVQVVYHYRLLSSSFYSWIRQHRQVSRWMMSARFEEYCTECHGAEVQENSKRFDNLKTDLKDFTLQLWQGVDQLNLGDMPPKDSLQPSGDEIADVIDRLTPVLRDAYAQHKSTGAQTVTRRLNRFELRNTVRDLLYINDPELRIGNKPRLVDNNGNGRVENTSTDPFRSVPGDEVEEGFDNIGNRLVMSDFFLRLMFDAAEKAALATYTQEKPKIETRDYKGLLLRTLEKIYLAWPVKCPTSIQYSSVKRSPLMNSVVV